jgi:hypothetical protein
MSDSLRPRTFTTLTLSAFLVVAVAACGGGGGASTATSPVDVGTTSTQTAAPTPDTGDDTAAGDGGSALAGLAPADTIQDVLGELPAPECDTSVLSGNEDCVWMAADGSWVKVQYGESAETPTVDEFTSRMNDTLGLTEPAPGLGEAAFTYAGPRGARIAVYEGDGVVLWVSINKAGDGATQRDQVTSMAEAIFAGL